MSAKVKVDDLYIIKGRGLALCVNAQHGDYNHGDLVTIEARITGVEFAGISTTVGLLVTLLSVENKGAAQ